MKQHENMLQIYSELSPQHPFETNATAVTGVLQTFHSHNLNQNFIQFLLNMANE